MPLSPEQGERFHAWLEKHGLLKECPCCRKQTRWKINNEIVMTLPVFEAAKTIPLAQAVCANCFFVLQFDAQSLGFVV
jgi:hypothetical protein